MANLLSENRAEDAALNRLRHCIHLRLQHDKMQRAETTFWISFRGFLRLGPFLSTQSDNAGQREQGICA